MECERCKDLAAELRMLRDGAERYGAQKLEEGRKAGLEEAAKLLSDEVESELKWADFYATDSSVDPALKDRFESDSLKNAGQARELVMAIRALIGEGET